MRWFLSVAFVAGLVSAGPSFALPFSVVGNPPGRVVIFDDGSRAQNGATITATYYTIHREASPDGTQYEDASAEFDCEGRRFRILNLAYRRLDGTEIRSIRQKSKWSELSRPNRLLERACEPKAGEGLLDPKREPLSMFQVLLTAVGAMRDGSLK